MPFSTAPRERVIATGRACRAIVATRLTAPARELEALRALHFGWFTTTLLLDRDDAIADALRQVPGLDVEAVIQRLDDAEVSRAYKRDREEARSAAGGAAELQGKAAAANGRVRYTAPSLVFRHGRSLLEAGGFQTIEAYDVLVANLDPSLNRLPAPRDAAAVLERFPEGLTTVEVAAVMAQGNEAPDRRAAEAELIDLVAAGAASRTPLAGDALWRLPTAAHAATAPARQAA